MQNLLRKACFENAKLITIDGIRAEFPNGWGLVRASNTSPYLTLRFEADSRTALENIQSIFRHQLLNIDPKLKINF